VSFTGVLSCSFSVFSPTRVYFVRITRECNDLAHSQVMASQCPLQPQVKMAAAAILTFGQSLRFINHCTYIYVLPNIDEYSHADVNAKHISDIDVAIKFKIAAPIGGVVQTLTFPVYDGSHTPPEFRCQPCMHRAFRFQEIATISQQIGQSSTQSRQRRTQLMNRTAIHDGQMPFRTNITFVQSAFSC